ncbi:MAG TPA: inorganic diphosphatase [Candidatus Onthoplasma faecigallinarum]|nr:inorganic diphosphatase [Candidatus Onthoplasma faecigallinarum]
MNIWKDVSRERIKADDFIACIEIQQGDKTKYELDKETGLLIMDRVLYTSTYYPMNYGFIPLTLSEDHDPLDVFVLCSQPLARLSLVRCYPIGVVTMTDRDEQDEKIIAIPFGDPQYNSYDDISKLPKHMFDELQHFLTVYKQLENKKVQVESLGDHEKAKEIIEQSLIRYKKNMLSN